MTYHDIDIPLPAFIAIDWIGMTLALVPIVLRFWLRYREYDARKPPHWTLHLSDGLVVLSWLSGLVLILINTWKNAVRQRYAEAGWPADALYYGVPRPQAAHLLYVSWISLYCIYVALWAAKFSLLAFFASLVRLTRSRAAGPVLAAAAAVTALTFALHMALLAAWCRPVRGNWDVDGHLCSAVHSITAVTVSTGANVGTDLVILALPLFALALSRRERRRNSNAMNEEKTGAGVAMSRAEWSGVAFVLAMAALSIVAALARYVCLELVQNVPKADITHTIDVWALVEIVASLLAVCLPSLRSFVRRRRQDRERRAVRGCGGSREKLVV
ncbi:hypothetical protein F4780DRAFT_132572 [Xylariomycetidae sp. FL0641]|nr:hypothetical protein F4780DRAFT_132572 [Xylariomycetidae sp. FL0641]